MKIFDSWKSWAEAKQSLALRLPVDTLNSLEQAFRFATGYHSEQKRPNGDPYIVHLLEVLEILTEGGITDKDILLAGVLHDIVEDTSCSLEEIERNFGVKVANLVEWLTESVLDRKKYAAQARERYLAKLKAAPLDVVVIKLADRLSNVQKLDTHPKVEKQRTYYRETIEKIMPLSKCSPWFSAQFKAWKNQFSFLAESEQS